MFKNYFKISLRNLFKHRAYSFINISGLAVGIACCLLIFLFVRDELSYDTQHENADRIYRVTREWFDRNGVSTLHLARVAAPIAPALKNEFPEVLESVRFLSGDVTVSYKENHFSEDNFCFVEPGVFDVFTFPLIKGDSRTALSEPFTVVLTEEMAEKYFGAEDPIGKVLRVENIAELKVTGVLQNLPRNLHFHFGFLASFATLEAIMSPDTWTNWGFNNYATYLLLSPNHNAANLTAKFPAFMDTYYKHDASKESRLHLQRLTDIHLHSHLDSELGVNGDISDVYIFSVVALFVLLIACFNFTNLTVARAIKRAREIGVRKVVGAHRWQLIGQFLGESIMIAFIAVLLAAALVELALPAFNDFTEKELGFLAGNLIAPLIGLIALALTVGIIAGSYPAFFLSAFRPAKVLKGETASGSSRPGLRKVLVVAQFAISIVLISGVLMIHRQLEYVQNKRLGFNKEQLLFFGPSTGRMGDFTSFRNQLLRHPGVRAVTASKFVPSQALVDNIDIQAEVGDVLKTVNELALLAVDHQFFTTYGMEMAAGRAFSPDLASDSTEALIVNETAARTIGWKSPGEAVGKHFSLESNFWGDRRGKVVGVVKDFHFESLHERISPMIFFISPRGYNRITVKIAAANIPETLEFIESVWQRFLPSQPFTYDFVDQRFAQLYRAEERLAQVVVFFASLAIFIACLGLLGLASFMAEQRTKEIGIRKILGATVAHVSLLLSKDFLKLVIIANLIAWPIAYFTMNRWLQNFAYRIEIEWWVFVLAGGLALLIALLTVSYQAIKAALANPVESLRYE